jgi:hypothetical protein
MKNARFCAVTLALLACSITGAFRADAASPDLLSGFKFKPGEWLIDYKRSVDDKVSQGKSSMCVSTAAPIKPEALGIDAGDGCQSTILSKQSDGLDYRIECPGASTLWHLRQSADGNVHLTGHTTATQGPFHGGDSTVNVTYVGPVCGSSGVASTDDQMQQIQCKIVAKNYDRIKSQCIANNGAANCASQIAQMDAVRASCGQH